MPLFNEDVFRQNFRISRDLFNWILEQIGNDLQKEELSMQTTISPAKRLAIGLYTLATTAEYRTIANLFGVSRSTVCVIFEEVIDTIVSRLYYRYIKLPVGKELSEVIDGFRTTWGFPQCAGAIDGTHFAILAPVDNAADYYNRKAYHSMHAQFLVDHTYLIRSIVVGWPGSVHDSRVFGSSSLYEKITQTDLLSSHTKIIEGESMPAFFVGDSAYPLSENLLKPYRNVNLTSNQMTFNYRLSRARVVVECAIGRLIRRWRRLSKRIDCATEKVSVVILAAAILHNLCELNKTPFLARWLDDTNTAAIQQPPSLPCNAKTAKGEAMRTALVKWCALNPL
ncbi:unnamed protein product [Rotaria sp. Silwood1]|nr:unnamed protein product [Rotaria sp. Silwood1]